MTRRLFWEDAYAREFYASIVTITGNKVVLDQTAFNPRGGGLVSDLGTIEGSAVSEVLKDGEEISHLVEDADGLTPGAKVHGILDWDRRYKIMKMHTSAHILCAVVNRETGALITGNQINPDESRIDFSLESLDREKIAEYISMANDAVTRGLEVKSSFMRREDALATPGLVKLANAMPPSVDILRIVAIGDLDTQADGGVHVANTKEIGEIVLGRIENKGKNNRRLYYSLR